MRPNAIRLFALTVLAVLVFQPIVWGQQVSVHPLILQPVDETQLVLLKGNTHPLARPQFDQGAAPPNLPMERMLLVLRRSPEQESALRNLLDNQQDKASPSYHRWLTPEQFGKQFGPADEDLQIVTSWLQVHGFQVAQVAKGRAVIEFSGTAAQVQEAFHTGIHKYVVNGEEHWANANDPQIPAALTPVVAGVHTLHNFLKKPYVHMSKEPVAAKFIADPMPHVTFSDGTHALGPSDYAKIYNIPQTGVDGMGITIAIVGRSNINTHDIMDFRSAFGLPFNFPQVVLNGPDPGDLGGGEEFEAVLDSTWPGVVAQNAMVDFVVSASTNSTDGVDLSRIYIIDNNLGDVMTESFGQCEFFFTSGELDSISTLAEQAAAQGITYMVSTGDSGSDGCDDPNFVTQAKYPPYVNALASSWYTVAVGGTMFNENGQTSKYWSSTPPLGETVLSYIPENVWNESCASATCAGIWAGGGGASAFFAKPSWQPTSLQGVPNDGARDLPDVSLTSASHDPYLLCIRASCQNNFIYFVWGTSAAAPSFAGIMALVDQKTGSRQGDANYVLYRLAAAENFSQCNGSNVSVAPASNCVFNDVTQGNNAVPGEVGYGTPNGRYQSTVGYDLATGLGSVNVTNMVNAWSAMTFNATTTTLLLNNSTNPINNVVHGSSVVVNVSVMGNSGMPTGDVTLSTNGQNIPLCTIPNSCTLSPSGTLNIASLSTTTNLLPGGTSYMVTAHYPGDGKFAPSDSSPPIFVSITGEQSTTTASIFAYLNGLPVTQAAASSVVYLNASVTGQSGFGVPTGNVTFMDNGTILAGGPYMLNSQANTGTPNGLPPCSLAAGSHALVAGYSGDQSFNLSSSQAATFTITTADFCLPTSLASIGVTDGFPGTTTLVLTASPGFTTAVSFACSGLPAEAKCSFSPASISGSGATTITVTTTAPHPAVRTARGFNRLGWWTTSLGVSLAGIVLLGVPSRRRRMNWSSLSLLVVVTFLLMLPSCGGGSSAPPPPPPDPGTPKGSYSIVVTATSGSMSHATTFTLTVQ
jgi:subtilase family serine protease